MADRVRDSRSDWLLSKDALPRIAVPDHPVQVVREFRLPTCIGKPARYGIAHGTPAPELCPDGKFRDRTLAWFSLGEERAKEECAEFDAAPPTRRRRALFAAAVASAGVLAAVTLLVCQ